MQCPKCGGPMWDNRQTKKTEKSPDFRCKDSVCGSNQGVVWCTPKPKAKPKPVHEEEDEEDYRSNC